MSCDTARRRLRASSTSSRARASTPRRSRYCGMPPRHLLNALSSLLPLYHVGLYRNQDVILGIRDRSRHRRPQSFLFRIALDSNDLLVDLLDYNRLHAVSHLSRSQQLLSMDVFEIFARLPQVCRATVRTVCPRRRGRPRGEPGPAAERARRNSRPSG